jgi:hypothetical protein
MSAEIFIPKRNRGRPSAAAQLAYQEQVEEFCRRVREIRASLDFEVSARGWCYILEEHGATKADFPTIENLFVACRKSGDLPINICAEDEARAAEHVEELDDETPEEFARGWVDYIRDEVHVRYNPVSLWNGCEYYCELWVEKIDLKSLFSDICKRYTIPLVNIRGRTCLNSRAGTMRRFLERDAEGKTCVLLYCGDHDPSGLDISGSIISDIEGATGYWPDDLIVDRFGLNFDFIEAERLSWSENLVTSSGEDLAGPSHPDHNKLYVQNYLRQFGARKVEANALVVRPDAGRQLCLDAIRRYSEPDEKLNQVDALIVLARAAVETFFQYDERSYADVRIDGHRETWPIRGPWFRRWLRRLYHSEHNKSPRPEALKEAADALDGAALFEGKEMQVGLRVAGRDGRIYLDLGTKDWSAVEIDESGWRVVDEPPVRFRRPRGMRPLPVPKQGGSIGDLRRFLNVSDDGFVLVVAWLLAAYRPEGPYPLLAVSGEQGTAKSTLVAILRSLIDPNMSPLRSLPREDRDIFIAATNGHLQAFDNVSGLPDWLSDTLCRLATGGGFAVRQLYTDDDEVLFDACRPIVLNGIGDMIHRGDLSDRTVFVTLDPIQEKERRAEEELWAEFHREQPAILGALLDAVAHGLKHKTSVRLDGLPRMADFAKWAAACEGAFWKRGTFMEAYRGNQATAVEAVIEADVVALAVRKLMETRIEWTGTAAALKDALDIQVLGIDGRQRAPKGWPATPSSLSNRLRRAATALRKTGLEVEFDREGKDRTRTIHIAAVPRESMVGKSASAASAASKPKTTNGLGADGGADGADGKTKSVRQSVRHNPLKNHAADGADGADGLSRTSAPTPSGIPGFLQRDENNRVPADRRHALGPVGDSLDDLQ